MHRPDHILVEDYLLEDDNKALTEVWNKHKDNVYNAILSKVNFMEVVAEDLLQDCFIKAKSAFDRGLYDNDKGSVGSYFRTIGINLAMDYQRSKKKIPSKPHDKASTDDDNDDIDKMWNIIATSESAENIIIGDENNQYLKDKINLLLDGLPPKYKDIVHMRFFERKQFNVIEEQTGINMNTLKVRMFRAMELMREAIKTKGLFKEKAVREKPSPPKKKSRKGIAMKRRTLIYAEAKKIMKPLGLRSKSEFDIAKEEGKIPEGIPAAPYQTYKISDGTWVSWDDFLGVDVQQDYKEEVAKGEPKGEEVIEEEVVESLQTDKTEIKLQSVVDEFKRNAIREEILQLETDILIATGKLNGLKALL